MKLPLVVVFTKGAAKSLDSLDAPTRKRIMKKIDAVAADPLNPRHSYPLIGSSKRAARVGGFRILLVILDPNLLVVEIETRGQVYRRI
jgi:mRNA-degrading endonuclease RelE of RelBE toxin-antitoxin system